MATFLEIIDTRSGDARHTGIGVMFETAEITKAQFELARKFHDDAAPFLLDLYIDDDLEDTIHLTAESVELISGTQVESVEFYIKTDEKYWDNVRKSQNTETESK